MNKEEIVSNDFLFEIEDKIYLITQIFIVILGSTLLLLLLSSYNYNLEKIFDSGRLGRLVIVFSIPMYIYYIIKTLYYILIQKRKTIKFYPTYILLSNNTSIILKDIKKIYKVKLNLLIGLSKKNSASKSKKLLYLFALPFVLIGWFLLLCCALILYKKKYIDNLMFTNNKNERFAGIGYRLMNEKEQRKVTLYFEKYLNINIDEIEQKLVFLT
ncbi:hypothetical protein CP985_15040 [Malaciobacter mytili LMG 24559]|uniref:RDD domain-containing protein n=1 Tax=Malaciobacter mytili LMG 24559 TaxID=1032238 RepID=A0AAX2AAV3_9BACT|nr:hypothetical protein [Malaciobacter mytili]AXH15462.1 putative membrane protein [Malaciobacter mytili LMG 24559]RXK11576.1 hypothetical protein CP985_15040 [Malaciobacter mytili LMG 24559]